MKREWEALLRLYIGGIIGVIIGAYISQYVSREFILVLLGGPIAGGIVGHSIFGGRPLIGDQMFPFSTLIGIGIGFLIHRVFSGILAGFVFSALIGAVIGLAADRYGWTLAHFAVLSAGTGMGVSIFMGGMIIGAMAGGYAGAALGFLAGVYIGNKWKPL